MRSLAPFPAAFAALLVVAAAAHAVDGVLEINQTCAVNAGCFAGDTPGLPVTISAAGSYRLTSNLVVPDPNTDGIQLSAPDVSIDLGGFEIVGAGCVGATTSCTPATGTGIGVNATSLGIPGASVSNGSITGMGGFGLRLGIQAKVTHLRVRWNRSVGIFAYLGSGISGNIVYENGGSGIEAEDGASISGNTAFGNGGSGITAGDGSTVSGNTSDANGFDGIDGGLGSRIFDNAARQNTLHGITASGDSLIVGNTVSSNLGSGIRAAGSGSRIEDNNAANNLRGFEVAAGGNIILKNTAHTNSSGNYSIVAGNSHGPLVNVVGVGDISATAGADHPWANFGY
jgi:parallel beta-helix repeat protein